MDAKDRGALLRRVAFGIPGSPDQAILLGGFIARGLQPGPLLIRDHMDIVYALLIFFFGFFLVTPVFLSAFLIRKGRMRPTIAILCGLFTTLLFCGFVQGLFKIDLWLGAVPQLIPHILGGSIVPPL